MHSSHIDPMHREDPTVAALELALRDACARAVRATEPLALALRLFRSVMTLARGLRLARGDAGLPPVLAEDLVGMLEVVMGAAAEHLRDPAVPVAMAIRLHRTIAALAREVHRGRAAGAVRGYDPLHREDRSDPPADAAADTNPAEEPPIPAVVKDPLHREPLDAAAVPVGRAGHAAVRGFAVGEAPRIVLADMNDADVEAESLRRIAGHAALVGRGAGVAERPYAP